MNPHKVAWRAVQPTLFSNVCEITSRPDWGFKQDRGDILNVTAEEFLDSPFFSDTIVLHILAGEGVPLAVIQDLIPVVYDNCVKLVVLEHNPISSDWGDNADVSVARLQFLLDNLRLCGDSIFTKDLGRNILFTMTTLHPLELPELSDSFYEEEIDKKFVGIKDIGIDIPNRVYVTTSEFPLPDKYLPMIPEDLKCTWVIGGQWYLETVPKLPNNEHHLIDVVLLQTIFARYVIEDDRDAVFLRKMSSLYDVDELKRMADDSPDELFQDNGYRWRNVIKDRSKYKGIKNQISSIRLGDVTDLEVEEELVYTSTIECRFLSKRLMEDNYVIGSTFSDLPRNNPILKIKESIHE
jgi:hypothetical protein